ncbi:MAG: hypothetical protein N2380_08095 [bacterium]|nr:hypothetical protein [bacterium]
MICKSVLKIISKDLKMMQRNKDISLRFTKHNSASSVAGFLDFSSYIGSALASVITGIVATRANWHVVILLWGLLSLGGVLIIHLSQRRTKDDKS